MMGKSHTAMGLAAGAGIGLAVFGVNSSTWLIPAVAVCGAALLPDIDEPGSSVSREFGLVSRGFSVVINKIAGGHRKLTHSLLGLAIVMALLGLLAAGREGSAILFGLLAVSAWRIVIPWWFGLRHLFVLGRVGAGGISTTAILLAGSDLSRWWVRAGWFICSATISPKGGLLCFIRGGPGSLCRYLAPPGPALKPPSRFFFTSGWD